MSQISGQISGQISESVAAVNQRLRNAGVRLTLIVRGNTLSVRGTLPSKDGVGQKRERLRLGLPATEWGVKQAEFRAYQIWSEIVKGTFRWEVKKEKVETFGEVIERFRNSAYRDKTDQQWLAFYKAGLQLVQMDQPFQVRQVELAISGCPDGSWLRFRSVQTWVRILRFLKVSEDSIDKIKKLKGSYQYGSVVKRLIPTDEEISQARLLLKSPEWQKVFALMAIYGLRDHECWHCQVESEEPYRCRVLVGKTGERMVLPLPPHWVDWEPWLHELPRVKFSGNMSVYADRTARYFRNNKVGFPPYSLRHAYAIRASVSYGFPVSMSAKLMGHGVEVHTRIYHAWLSEAQLLETYKRMTT
ncbi:hypothetical protein [Synechococcus sp. PCC 6312]|uniref:hypothetical protein n=1 Tax=Synechococcus sp. (strain ATCC 27167 / PCC 6312) TaxID=195253 RepID=UPI00029F43C3|nr:hypothetical protein [Synechococcus sp. PCC 6312]AFY61827.1 hypothetical protein Syn6312_2747 [Synechococcus sp. PCC 6312]